MLAIDANVCVPRDGADDLADPAQFHDPTDGGWRAVLAHRAHLFAWMATRRRGRRRRASGSSSSHYPALDPLGGVSSEEVALFGATGLARRAPTAAVADAFAATGVSLHFSGHLHVNDTARHETVAGRFVNIAVPSPVGYGPGLKIASISMPIAARSARSLRQVPGHDAAFAAYRAEAAREGAEEPAASSAADHGAFLSRHLVNLVHGRYLAREWPREMVEFARTATVADLLEALGFDRAGAPTFGLGALVEDWYRLRKAVNSAMRTSRPTGWLSIGTFCARAPHIEGDGLPARFATLLRMMRAYLERPPNRDFSLSLPDLAVRAL